MNVPPLKIEADTAVASVKSTLLPVTNNEPVISASPSNGNPAPVPPPAFNANDAVNANDDVL